jgi:hypothetical protein
MDCSWPGRLNLQSVPVSTLPGASPCRHQIAQEVHHPRLARHDCTSSVPSPTLQIEQSVNPDGYRFPLGLVDDRVLKLSIEAIFIFGEFLGKRLEERADDRSCNAWSAQRFLPRWVQASDRYVPGAITGPGNCKTAAPWSGPTDSKSRNFRMSSASFPQESDGFNLGWLVLVSTCRSGSLICKSAPGYRRRLGTAC